MLPTNLVGGVFDECRYWVVAGCGRGNSEVVNGGLVLIYVCGIVYFVIGGEHPRLWLR